MRPIGEQVGLWMGITATIVSQVNNGMYVIQCDSTGEFQLMYEYAPFQFKFWDMPPELTFNKVST